MRISYNHIKQLHVLLTKAELNNPEDKKSLALQYSKNRTDRTSELTYQEYLNLIKDLQVSFVNEASGRISDKMRKKIISRAREMRWEIQDDNGRVMADMQRINNWAVKYGYLHKNLNDYTENELPQLVSQFDNVYFDYLRKV
jgi:hypothetical protein